jgi:hypothetical protein
VAASRIVLNECDWKKASMAYDVIVRRSPKTRLYAAAIQVFETIP